MRVLSPDDNSLLSSAEISVTGRASPDATVSVNGQLVAIDLLGEFETMRPMLLEEGPNLIEVIASDLAGNVSEKVLTVIYDPLSSGIFGRVSDVTTPFPGLTAFTLGTAAGDVTVVEAAENTIVDIPGRGRASATDISAGDFLAVLVMAGTPRNAVRILVKPEAPVVHAHITGSVLEDRGEQASILDVDGNLVTADLLLKGNGVDPAQVVTAVLHQDLKTGRLSILGAESADTKIARLKGALELPGSQENEANLKERLKGSITGHLTTIQQNLNRVDPGTGLFFDLALTLTSSLQGHQELLSSFDLGSPLAELAGIIQDIDRTQGTILVSPREGPKLQLQIIETTQIRIFGAGKQFANLELAHQIEALYDLRTKEANNINVIQTTLGENVFGSLLLQATAGELQGRVSEVDPAAVPPRIDIVLPTGRTVTLTVTPETRIQIGEQPGELENLLEIVQVKVRYDPSTMVALDIDTFDEEQTFISGVVAACKAKEGKISVASLVGETVTLSITQDVPTLRDGLRVPLGLIRCGDLVRATSRFDPDTREIQVLVLRRPELQGTIRGKRTTPLGGQQLTISTDELDLITVTVTDDPSAFSALTIGERLVSGLYDPLKLEASQLVVRPPKTLRVTGTVSARGEQFATVRVAPVVGAPLDLLLPKTAEIIKDGNPQATFSDINVGDKVQVAYYEPDTKVVVRIVVTSQ